ncbi:MAG: polyprenyltransferase, partial [Bacteroidota bacterium]
VSRNSTLLAIAITGLALLYDKYSKHIQVVGPLNMGLCRAGNLLLGMSISATALQTYWWIGIIPVLFISAITLTSQKENAGNNRASIGIAMLLDFSILLILGYLVLIGVMGFWTTVPLLLVWYGANAYAKGRAIRFNEPANVKKAVRYGILSLIPLDASLASGFSSNLLVGFGVMLLLPLSFWLAKQFAVT